MEIPTVPVAENISIKISDNDRPGSNPDITKALTAESSKLIKNTVLAFLIESSSILLPKIFKPLLLRNADQIYKSITIMVVVLIPPAVDPGLPPTNINITVKSLVGSEYDAVSVVLNPAVLGVTEPNTEDKSCPFASIPTKRLSRSNK